MFFSWLTNRRRRKLLAAPFPDAWTTLLENDVRVYTLLTPDEQAELRDYVRVFVAEKNWEGCGGLQLTDEMKVVVAAQAGLLVLGLGPVYFDAVLSILVYPDEYVAPRQPVSRGGLIVEEDSARLGEAWYRGPVILTWSEVLGAARRTTRGRNVVLHEFAHQLDMLNGRDVDGMPPLVSRDMAKRWTGVMRRHYRKLVVECQYSRPTVLDCYGATSLVEFFAVATEAFFESPLAMEAELAPLYELLRDFYRQDPAERERRAAATT